MPWSGGNTELKSFFKKAIAMRKELAPLRRGNFRMLSAEPGSRLLVFERNLNGEKVTVCIHCGKEPTRLPVIAGTLYWAEGAQDGTLAEQSFAIFSSRKA